MFEGQSLLAWCHCASVPKALSHSTRGLMSNHWGRLRSDDLLVSSLAKLATEPNSIRKILSLALIVTATALLIGSGSSAIAGGAFAESIQSAFGQGSSNAGVAAGGSLSSMFWNPAT